MSLLKVFVVFLLMAFPAFAAIDFSLSLVYNPVKIYRNSFIHVGASMTATNIEDGSFKFSGFEAPAGVTATGWCNAYNPTCPGVWMETSNGYNQSADFRIIVNAGPTATLGPGNVTFHVVRGELDKTISFPIEVLEAPTLPITPTRFPNPPTLPGLEQWSSTRTFLADKWCNPLQTFGFGYAGEFQVWYYDGARTYALLAEETINPLRQSEYRACALNIASQYRDYVMLGGTRGNAVFTWGLRWAYQYTGDISYKNAIQKLVSEGGNAWAVTIGDVDDRTIRETSYALRALVDARLLGITQDNVATNYPLEEREARAISQLIGYLHILSANPPSTSQAWIHQSFYTGFAMEALTYYFDNVEKDPRIPDIIKRTLDWYWTYMINPSTGAIFYNPFPINPNYPRYCQDECQVPHTDLNNIQVWAYYWYWRLVGDDFYRQQGDLLFAHSLDTDISYSGKIFNENYYLSQQAVKLRNIQVPKVNRGNGKPVGRPKNRLR